MKTALKVLPIALVLLFHRCTADAQMIEPSLETMSGAAQVILTGKVQAVTVEREAYDDGTWTTKTLVTVEVKKVIRGGEQPPVIVIEQLGGETEEGGMRPEGYVDFKPGEEYLFLLAGGKLLHAQEGAVPVDLHAPAPLSAVPFGVDRRSLADKLRDKFHLAPAPTPEAMAAPAEANASCCRHWTPGNLPPWPHFVGVITVRPPTEWDSKLGEAGSRLVIENSMNAWAQRSAMKWKWGTPTAGKGPGFVCGGKNELLWSWEDPKGQIGAPTSCQGALAIGGGCNGAVQSDGTRAIDSAAMVYADGWYNCPYADLTNMTRIGEHECGHCLGFAHSMETNETCTAQTLGCKARMYAYLHAGPFNECDVQCAEESYGLGGATPPAGATPTPAATAQPPWGTPTPGACPPGQYWKPRNKCPYPSGKWSRRCRCVDE